MAFINASYTLIVGYPALTAGLFAAALRPGAAKRETRKLQNRYSHRVTAKAFRKTR